MGYCYKNGRLCCDACGSVGARKRTCPHKVTMDRGQVLPNCQAPALCKACWEKYGKNKIHDQCRESAARSNAEYAAVRARIEAGDKVLRCCFGDWHADVPAGMVGMVFGDGEQAEGLLVTEEEYSAHRATHSFLSEYKGTPWNAETTTKQVALK